MRYVMVTLGNDDVEWITPQSDMKEAIWDDARFAEWLDDRDLLEALEDISVFQRDIGNQLRRANVTVFIHTGWRGRTLHLCHRLKRRRQELRAMVREQYGQEFLVRTVQSFDARHPRLKVGGAA